MGAELGWGWTVEMIRNGILEFLVWGTRKEETGLRQWELIVGMRGISLTSPRTFRY